MVKVHNTLRMKQIYSVKQGKKSINRLPGNVVHWQKKKSLLPRELAHLSFFNEFEKVFLIGIADGDTFSSDFYEFPFDEIDLVKSHEI